MTDKAIGGLDAGKPSWFPLASEMTLHELVAEEEIEKDSFTYVVYVQHVTTLAIVLDAQARDENASRQFWLRFSQLAAAASLASLVTPAGAVVAPAIRAVTLVTDLVFVGSTISSVSNELQRIQRLRVNAVVESSSALEALGRLGQLLAIRKDILDGLVDDARVQLLETNSVQCAATRHPARPSGATLAGSNAGAARVASPWQIRCGRSSHSVARSASAGSKYVFFGAPCGDRVARSRHLQLAVAWSDEAQISRVSSRDRCSSHWLGLQRQAEFDRE